MFKYIWKESNTITKIGIMSFILLSIVAHITAVYAMIINDILVSKILGIVLYTLLIAGDTILIGLEISEYIDNKIYNNNPDNNK